MIDYCETCASGSYFDGCNGCFCQDNGLSICTLIFCFEFQDPTCQCPDGSSVGPDPNKPCEFLPCPTNVTAPTSSPTERIFCTADVKQCPDGSFVSRDPNNNCQFFPCPLTPAPTIKPDCS